MNTFWKSTTFTVFALAAFYVFISNPKSVVTNVIAGYGKLTIDVNPPDTLTIAAGTPFIVSPDDYTQMMQKTALWAATMTSALNNRNHKNRDFDEAFTYIFFEDLIHNDFESWAVHSPFGEKVWSGKAAFLDRESGYINYNTEFANNANHVIAPPVIFYTGVNTATMLVSALNRTVERRINDNRIPMWQINIYWHKDGDQWRIVQGQSFYESPK